MVVPLQHTGTSLQARALVADLIPVQTAAATSTAGDWPYLWL